MRSLSALKYAVPKDFGVSSNHHCSGDVLVFGEGKTPSEKYVSSFNMLVGVNRLFCFYPYFGK